jgi:hypothetical protein
VRLERDMGSLVRSKVGPVDLIFSDERLEVIEPLRFRRYANTTSKHEGEQHIPVSYQ